jgi:Swt1-like HEPN
VARTNPALKAALLEKLGVSKQRLSQLVQSRKQELPMDTPQAVYTIAHENGIDISRHLAPEETKEVRGLVAALRNGRQAGQVPESAQKRPRRAGQRKDVKVTIAGVDVGKIPVLKPAHAKDAKRMSEEVFPLLYIFENSVRDLIERVLEAKHGAEWWDTVVPPRVRRRAEENKAAEGQDPWHGARGARPVDYVFLTDLWAIIKHRWPDFSALFPTQAWVESIITGDMNVSRRPLAHMNPIHKDDVTNIKAAFRKWTRQLQAVEGKLP